MYNHHGKQKLACACYFMIVCRRGCSCSCCVYRHVRLYEQTYNRLQRVKTLILVLNQEFESFHRSVKIWTFYSQSINYLACRSRKRRQSMASGGCSPIRDCKRGPGATLKCRVRATGPAAICADWCCGIGTVPRRA